MITAFLFPYVRAHSDENKMQEGSSSDISVLIKVPEAMGYRLKELLPTLVSLISSLKLKK